MNVKNKCLIPIQNEFDVKTERGHFRPPVILNGKLADGSVRAPIEYVIFNLNWYNTNSDLTDF